MTDHRHCPYIIRVCFDCPYCVENPEPHAFAEIWKCGRTNKVLHAPNCEGGIPEDCPFPISTTPAPAPSSNIAAKAPSTVCHGFAIDAVLRATVIETLRKAGCPHLAKQVMDDTNPNYHWCSDVSNTPAESTIERDTLYTASMVANRVAQTREKEREKIRVIVAHAIKEEREKVLDECLEEAEHYYYSHGEDIGVPYIIKAEFKKMINSLRTTKEGQ